MRSNPYSHSNDEVIMNHHPGTLQVVDAAPGTFGGVGGVVFDTIRDIKDKLIGVAVAENDGIAAGLNPEGIATVQEQVDIYSKELQAMNREIYALRKVVQEVQGEALRRTQSQQNVLKQVQKIKNEVMAMRVSGLNGMGMG